MSKGGSRYGAGRPGYRAKAEQLQRIDVRVWHRGGHLAAGRAFSWSWQSGGKPSGSIGVRIMDRERLSLDYSVGPPEMRRDGSQSILMTHTPCRFGGLRPWFNCPHCGRSVAMLYMRFGRFACRRCQRVAYCSQSEDSIGRGWRRQYKLEARLGEHGQRPKGMRRNTFERLLAEIGRIEIERDWALAGHLARLGLFG